MAKNQIQHQLMASGMQNMSKDIDKFVDNYETTYNKFT